MVSRRSAILLFFQLTLIGLIFMTSGVFASSTALLFVQITGIILGIWAAIFLFQRSKFNAFAEVREGASLIRSGPFKYIRNPIYSSIFLIQIPLVLEDLTIINITLVVLLAYILHLKIQMEEKYLHNEFSDYKEYKKNTWRLLPLIY